MDTGNRALFLFILFTVVVIVTEVFGYYDDTDQRAGPTVPVCSS